MSDDTTEGPTICIVLHDAAPSTRSACLRTLAAVRQVAGDVPLTLLAVPRYHDEPSMPEFEAWLGERSSRGDELALHGLTHLDAGNAENWRDSIRRSHYTRGEGEFWALPRGEALRRIDLGIEWFAKNGWPLSGFVAPAWLIGPGAWSAIVERPFDYTATLRELIHLPGRQATTSQSIVYSTSRGWRRSLSVAWNTAVAISERNNPVLRLELHPRDADFTGVRSSWQRILERALKTRKPATVAAFMRRTRPTGTGQSTVWQSTTAD
ncbi:MAG: polysaccharide deacetylase family protein [Caldimonas sp.]